MSTYRVIWEMDIEADNPREAAEEARNIMLDPDSEAVYFQVYYEADNRWTDIDLLEDNNG